MDQSLDYGFLLDNLLGNTADAIYFKDLQSRFILLNQACVDKHGRGTLTSIIGTTDFDTFSKEHAEQAYADEQRIIETGESLSSIEEKETWADGREAWVSTTKMPLRDEDGQIIGTFGISRDITQRKEAELRAKRYADEIRGIKEEMEEDLRMAGELQKSFFPSTYPVFPEGVPSEESDVEFLHHFNFCREVNGDYSAIQRCSAHEVGIFLCDVSGVGMRAALGTALIRGIMQEISALGSDPSAYLARMSELLFPLLRQEDDRLEVSACYLVLDVRTGMVRFANAGHPMPIYFQDGHAAQWLSESTSCVGPALATQAHVSYETVEVQVVPGDSVVLFTDGLCSSVNNVDDSYGKKRLLDSAHSLVGESLKEIFQGLEGDALAFSKDGKFSDDVSLVAFHLRQLMD